jgi:hypothetical protein
MFENLDHIIRKLIDLLKQAFSLKDNPDLICAQSRISAEAMLREIYKREFGNVPPKITFQSLLEGIRKKNVIPHQIILLFETVNRFGNMTVHPDDNLTSRTPQEAQIVESNLAGICNWFFNVYLKLEITEDILYKRSDAPATSANSNYEDMIRSALSDNKLELDEYENLLQARMDLGITDDQALIIEKQICNEVLNKKVDGIIDILSNSDLNAFKKLDKIRDDRPEWVTKSIEQISNSNNEELKVYLSHFFEELNVQNHVPIDSMFSIMGCWQGWYFQYTAKTYFDLLFLVRGENDFIGISIEPINPTWGDKGYEDPYLLAWIEGNLLDDILFSYRKTMLLEKTWSVDYQGVIIEDGTLFEGEWNIKSQNGSFNAMRSKSLLPIRIFDTLKKCPIVPSTYLNGLQDLTSSWIIQLTGKSSNVGIMHIIEVKNKLFANVVLSNDNLLCISYCEGSYDETAKATLKEVNAIKGNQLFFTISFTIDWNNNILNGTIKDDVYRMRVFKAFKL